MTRSEAIRAMQFYKEKLYNGIFNQYIDAFDMAISALRQQDVADKDVGKNEPLTNAQKIRSMSDDELAEFLIDLADDGNLKIREWIQQPAGEEDKHELVER